MKFRLSTIAAAALLAAAIGQPAAAAEYTMRLSHVFPPQHPLGKAASYYAEAVKEETGGRVAVEIFGAGQAFAEKESYPAVAKGQIDATLLVSVQFSGIVPALDVLSIPFVMTGNDSAKRFLASKARAKLDDEIRAKRVEPLAWLFQTNTTVFTSNAKKLVAIDDFKGVKIRGLNKVADASLVAVGASPLATPGSEVYQSLQSGILDAALTDISAALSRRYYEVQKHGTVVDNWVTAYGVLLANPAWMAKLPQDLRDSLKRAAAKAETHAIEVGAANVKQAVAGLEEKGMSLTFLDDAQESTWRKAMTAPSKSVFVERTGETGKEVLAAFESLSSK
ncbi:MAG: TRAP transporter substrate-binding protein DctP [Rhodospirillales bacterium]|nr:TRAP transporter substrate-binding protein DctP [Rhodospirillales bacterium]